MENNNLAELIKYLAADGDFLKIVREIFIDITNDIGLEDIELYQISPDGGLCHRILYVSDGKDTDTSMGEQRGVEEIIQSTEENDGAAAFPVFIRDEIAMYVIAHNDGFTNEIINRLVKMTLLIQNIAANKNFKDSLASSYKVLENALDRIPIGVAVLDYTNRTILLMNKVAAESEAVQNAMGIGLEKYLETGKTLIEEIYEDRTGLWFDVEFTDLVWINGDKVLICTTIDVTQKIKNQQRIEYQANNDYLTGLFNRMKCERDLSEIIKSAIEKERKGILIFLDLDNFKQVNDGLGHQYGDMLLQEIATAIQSVDAIKNNCYRMGGDEFVIIIRPEYFKSVSEIVDTISKRFNESWHIMDVDYYCTMSMGLAVFPDHGKDVDEIIKKADYAMYEAKKKGKNRYLWYTDEDEKNKNNKTEFETSIKDMVGNNFQDFEIHYQPVVDTEGNICGAEALVRINSGNMGRLMPAEFLPVAEYLGIMNRIGNHVFREACLTLARWNEKNPEFKMFINMAPTQLMVSKAAEQIINMVKETGANLGNVYCEVSENTDFRDADTALSTMEILNAYGINISLDDFGTGAMSLDFLKRSKASVIKFDASFTKHNSKPDFCKTILNTIISVARELAIDIAFIGIENAEQRNLAVEKGADYLEGFYYGAALPKEEFETRWL